MTPARDERRILGLDPGARRVGLAVSDPLGITAQGLATFDRRRDGNLMDRIRALLAEYDVARIVVGHPLALDGRETESTRLAADLAAALRATFGLPVDLWDERLSSVEAERTLRGERREKGAADRIAAVLILQGYLDAHRADERAPRETE